MGTYDFVIADVFTEEAFGGNQLAVLPDATGLSAGQMQRIAREFNFAESTFVFPAADPRHVRRMRIFTPRVEMPFAGHPTVGTAAVLADLGILEMGVPQVLEQTAGPVTVEVLRQDGACLASRFTLERELELRPSGLTHDAAAELLTLSSSDIVETWSASAGVPFCFVQVTTRDTVDRANLNRTVWSQRLRGMWASDVYVFAGDVTPDAQLYARMFGPRVGIDEDPATGSACVALVGTLAMQAAGGADGRVTARVEQGVALGRPSMMEATAVVEHGCVRQLRLGGSTVIVARGTLGG